MNGKVPVPDSGTRMLGIGYSVHGFGPPRLVLDFVERLPGVSGTKVFVFMTAGDAFFLNNAASAVVSHRFGENVFARLTARGMNACERCGARLFGKDLTVSSECILCDTCVQGCPTRNISKQEAGFDRRFDYHEEHPCPDSAGRRIDMQTSAKDKRILRRLAERYCEIAHLDVQQQRLERYRKTNALEAVRPVVLIDEVPWGEIKDEELTNICAPELEWLETRLRHTLYQWEHFQVDLVVPPVFRIEKRTCQRRGIGIEVHDHQIKGDTGAYIAAHAYQDQLQTEDDLAKLHDPEIVYDRAASEQALSVAGEVFAGLMEVGLVGMYLGYSIWDRIAMFRGVENLLMDLAVRPDFMHKTARRFMEIGQSEFRQIEEQGLLDPSLVLMHCTPACTRELPAEDFEGRVRPRDVWGRCAAQIFGSVSPDMHDEFDLAYNQELFKDCGLLYYGCCEPMDMKIDILRKRFKNLRKISITPWADSQRAAQNIGGDYVLAAKPNPAFVAMREFNPGPVEKEIADYCEACRRHGTTLEFVLKDISTIANNPGNLTQWAATVNAVIDKYYS